MKKINFKHALGSILFLIVLSVAQSAFAVEVVLTTEFKADMTKPTHNKFENTTPVSGFCRDHAKHCQEGEFSVLVPGFKAYKTFDADSTDLSKHTFISLDGTSKSVTLVDVKNPANQITVQFRWSFLVSDIIELTQMMGICSKQWRILEFTQPGGAQGVPELEMWVGTLTAGGCRTEC
ncbi:hypothetical protein CEP65_025035 [Enterobacter hormaechei]|nr:hypothetical protein CEP65_025035 [Enterobacter hormaechei]